MTDPQFFFWGCIAFACCFILLFKTARLLHKIETALKEHSNEA